MRELPDGCRVLVATVKTSLFRPIPDEAGIVVEIQVAVEDLHFRRRGFYLSVQEGRRGSVVIFGALRPASHMCP